MKKSKCTIYYVAVADYVSSDEKKEFLSLNRLNFFNFNRVNPDRNHNWINIADTNFNDLIPLFPKVSSQVSNEINKNTIFEIYSNGINTGRDEWVYDFNKSTLLDKIIFFIEEYNSEVDRWIRYKSEKRLTGRIRESDPILGNFVSEINRIKWSGRLKRDKLLKQRKGKLDKSKFIKSIYRPYCHQFIYLDYIAIDVVGRQLEIFPYTKKNVVIAINFSSSKDFHLLSSDRVVDLHFVGDSVCLPLYRYDQDGNRIDNITDWGLEQFRVHYNDLQITKEDIFHYTYAVLHNPAYSKKYELNLKREFPRLPFYQDFYQWVNWGKQLMDLHIKYETVPQYSLKRLDIPISEGSKRTPKTKLKSDKANGIITLDDVTTLEGIPKEAWDYKLGNRSALEWILDQYKEKKPKDPTIAARFNTYRFADYKEQVIDLLQRVCTVSVETMRIIQAMPDE